MLECRVWHHRYIAKWCIVDRCYYLSVSFAPQQPDIVVYLSPLGAIYPYSHLATMVANQ